jgi:hypothetical protein
MVMCFKTDVFVDTETYDTDRIPVVKNFFSTLFRLLVVSSISRCDVGGDSDAIFVAVAFSEPENFTRTDQSTESSYRVSASRTQAEPRFLLRKSSRTHGTITCLKHSSTPPISGSASSATR